MDNYYAVLGIAEFMKDQNVIRSAYMIPALLTMLNILPCPMFPANMGKP